MSGRYVLRTPRVCHTDRSIHTHDRARHRPCVSVQNAVPGIRWQFGPSVALILDTLLEVTRPLWSILNSRVPARLVASLLRGCCPTLRCSLFLLRDKVRLFSLCA